MLETELRETPIAPVWAATGYVEVLVDCPGVTEAYTYTIGADQAIGPGDVLTVPFGGRSVGAIALRCWEQLPEGIDPARLREVEGVVASGLFSPDYWQLLAQVADYYCASLIQVARVALPPGVLGRASRRVRLADPLPASAAAGVAETLLSPIALRLWQWLRSQSGRDYSWRFLQQKFPGGDRGLRDLVRRGWLISYLESPSAPKPKRQQMAILIGEGEPLTPRQREIVGILQRRGGELLAQELIALGRTSSGTLRSLEEKGWLILEAREILRGDQHDSGQRDRPKTLTPAQATALETIHGLESGQTALLHGVTGSGKTEVYLQAIAPVLARGQSALVLVPEIGLTPQLTDRFRARFGSQVCVYHSGLSGGERYDTWRKMLDGAPQVVIGTRSAVFAPLPNLGLILLDEEHDPSFKQDSPTPCYHARQVAQWRSRLVGCPLVLGSATPSMETWTSQRVYVSLPDRVHGRPLPPVEVVDMRQELQDGNRSIFSRSLQGAIASSIAAGRQGILFVQRRGHSTFVSCRSCGHVMMCPHCDVSLSFHHQRETAQPLLRCHFCGFGQLHPPACPACGSPYLKHFGSGTQRVVRELERQWPDLRILRYDSDTTRTKDAHRILLDRFARGEADLLVGTQMLTKGIDLPQVTLVGAIAADGLLNLSDVRAGERAVQTLLQVAGRAGRGEEPGRVILQTYSPEHPAIGAVANYDYPNFLEQEREMRAALNYPPVGQLILLRLSGPDEAAVGRSAEQVAALLETAQGDRTFDLLGPERAQVGRIANRFRWQLLIRVPPEGDRPANLLEVRSACLPGVSLTIDVDPLNFL
ncbi:MAG: primosomal protein N' [Limnothrix sp. CACIAM 69d]|nr:MAG: primosomal protein N' [Limnothrix sp. CACIAM 69d]